MASAGSTSNAQKSRRPAHVNKIAFIHNVNSKKTAKILSLPNCGLCQPCHDKIEWRKKYRKYKPLTQPSHCHGCQTRNVKAAYHKLCKKCANDQAVCPKCMQPRAIHMTQEQRHKKAEVDAKNALMQPLKERERRKLQRKLLREAIDRSDEKRAVRRELASKTDKMLGIMPDHMRDEYKAGKGSLAAFDAMHGEEAQTVERAEREAHAGALGKASEPTFVPVAAEAFDALADRAEEEEEKEVGGEAAPPLPPAGGGAAVPAAAAAAAAAGGGGDAGAASSSATTAAAAAAAVDGVNDSDGDY